MAWTYTIAPPLALFLALQPLTATCNFLSPLLAPIFDDVCKEVECGKGTCKPSSNSTFSFECECSHGWKQAPSEDDDNLKFLPCVIPNCTLDYSCTKAPSTVQNKENRSNESFFDPCHWADCGGGTCNKTSPFTHKCECSQGYYNLLNVTVFPCFSECSLGMDCKNLGLTVLNRSTPSSQTPSLSDNNSNQGSSMARGELNWLIATVISLALVWWK